MWTRSKSLEALTPGLERRKHVALPQLSRVREYLVELERSEQLYLVTCVQVLSSPQTTSRQSVCFDGCCRFETSTGLERLLR